MSAPARAAVVTAAVVLAGCAGRAGLRDPSPEALATQSPDSFVVEMVTSEGSFEMVLHRAWSPLAVDRAYWLFANDYYAGARFFRVVPGFVAQWGLTGDPVLDSIWRTRGVPDEDVRDSNTRGAVSFARSGPSTRSTQLFINLVDNVRLDTLPAGGVVGYPPIGRIRDGMAVVDGFYGAYGQPPAMQDSIRAFGTEFLERHYPQLDSIVRTRVVQAWR